MPDGPRKRYGKDALRMAECRSRASLAADGVSQQSIRRKSKKTDEEFLASLVESLHGIAIALEARDLKALSHLESFTEARSFAFIVHRKFVTTQQRGANDKT